MSDNSQLNAAQRIAYLHPCFLAEETTAERFGFRLPPPNGDASLRLTVNIGLE